MLKRFKISVCLLLFVICLKAQTNLVPNGSFEQYTQCPFNFGQVNFAQSWINANMADPELFSICASSGTFSTPQNYFGYQIPTSGNNYVGLSVLALDTGGLHTYGEYISVELNQILTANENYTLSYYIVLADSSEYAVKNIGAYFSNSDITNLSSFETFSYDPQIVFSNFVTDSVNWVNITGNFTAVGGEQYMTLGYYRDSTDAIDSMRIGYYPTLTKNIAYYLIDSVNLYRTSELINLPVISTNSKIVRKDFCLNKNYNGAYVDFISLTNYKKLTIEIYNCEGVLVWKNSSQENRWYGTNNGNEECSLGFYTYKIVDQLKIFTGKIIVTNN